MAVKQEIYGGKNVTDIASNLKVIKLKSKQSSSQSSNGHVFDSRWVVSYPLIAQW